MRCRLTDSPHQVLTLGRKRLAFNQLKVHPLSKYLVLDCCQTCKPYILGSELLNEIGGLSKEQADLNSMVVRAGHSLLSIISDVLDFSKMEAG